MPSPEIAKKLTALASALKAEQKQERVNKILSTETEWAKNEESKVIESFFDEFDKIKLEQGQKTHSFDKNNVSFIEYNGKHLTKSEYAKIRWSEHLKK